MSPDEVQPSGAATPVPSSSNPALTKGGRVNAPASCHGNAKFARNARIGRALFAVLMGLNGDVADAPHPARPFCQGSARRERTPFAARVGSTVFRGRANGGGESAVRRIDDGRPVSTTPRMASVLGETDVRAMSDLRCFPLRLHLGGLRPIRVAHRSLRPCRGITRTP